MNKCLWYGVTVLCSVNARIKIVLISGTLIWLYRAFKQRVLFCNLTNLSNLIIFPPLVFCLMNGKAYELHDRQWNLLYLSTRGSSSCVASGS